MSIRSKVALALALAAAAATVVVATVAYRSTRDRLYTEVDRSLEQVIGLGAGPIRLGERLPERGPLSDFAAQLVGPNGQVLQSTFPEPIPPGTDGGVDAGPGLRASSSTVESGGDRFRVRTISSDRGTVLVGRPLDETDRVLAALRLRLILAGLVVAAAAAGVGWWIASRLTVPLRRLTTVAERIGTSGDVGADVTADLPPPDSGGAGRGDEVDRLSGAFGAMVEALSRSRAEQRRLVQDAGHELRTPLTSLRTNLDTLLRHPDLAGTDRDAIVADLHAETDELTSLVNEVIAAATGELDDGVRTEVDLVGLARQTAERATRRYERPVEVTGADLAIATADAAAIQRALSSLVDNAAKFDTTGGPVSIDVVAVGADGSTATGAGGRVTVTVLDRGPGIAPGDRELVVQRFGRADAARSLPGSGLGLAIVTEVARRHGGDVVVGERPGGGAAVGFWLPT